MSMKSAVATLGCVLLAACGGSGGGSSITDVQDALFDAATFDSGPVQGADTGADDTNFAGILNGLRLSRGHDTLSYDSRLDAAAQKYAVEQASIAGLSHTGLNGSDVGDRIRAEGYNPRGWAENLAKGQQSQQQVLQAWIDSPGHNANLNAGLEDFALGVAGSGSSLSWVLVMATER